MRFVINRARVRSALFYTSSVLLFGGVVALSPQSFGARVKDKDDDAVIDDVADLSAVEYFDKLKDESKYRKDKALRDNESKLRKQYRELVSGEKKSEDKKKTDGYEKDKKKLTSQEAILNDIDSKVQKFEDTCKGTVTDDIMKKVDARKSDKIKPESLVTKANASQKAISDIVAALEAQKRSLELTKSKTNQVGDDVGNEENPEWQKLGAEIEELQSEIGELKKIDAKAFEATAKDDDVTAQMTAQHTAIQAQIEILTKRAAAVQDKADKEETSRAELIAQRSKAILEKTKKDLANIDSGLAKPDELVSGPCSSSKDSPIELVAKYSEKDSKGIVTFELRRKKDKAWTCSDAMIKEIGRDGCREYVDKIIPNLLSDKDNKIELSKTGSPTDHKNELKDKLKDLFSGSDSVARKAIKEAKEKNTDAIADVKDKIADVKDGTSKDDLKDNQVKTALADWTKSHKPGDKSACTVYGEMLAAKKITKDKLSADLKSECPDLDPEKVAADKAKADSADSAAKIGEDANKQNAAQLDLAQKADELKKAQEAFQKQQQFGNDRMKGQVNAQSAYFNPNVEKIKALADGIDNTGVTCPEFGMILHKFDGARKCDYDAAKQMQACYQQFQPALQQAQAQGISPQDPQMANIQQQLQNCGQAAEVGKQTCTMASLAGDEPLADSVARMVRESFPPDPLVAPKGSTEERGASMKHLKTCQRALNTILQFNRQIASTYRSDRSLQDPNLMMSEDKVYSALSRAEEAGSRADAAFMALENINKEIISRQGSVDAIFNSPGVATSGNNGTASPAPTVRPRDNLTPTRTLPRNKGGQRPDYTI